MLSTLDRSGACEFALTTADRREWRVTVSSDAVSWLTDCDAPGEHELARLWPASGHHLELAALRRIARDRTDGRRLVIDAADLGRA